MEHMLQEDMFFLVVSLEEDMVSLFVICVSHKGSHTELYNLRCGRRIERSLEDRGFE